MPALVAWLTRLVPWILSSVIGDNVLRFAAGKILLTSLFLVVLPLILNNFLYDVMSIMMNVVASSSAGISFSGTLTFSGLCAHFLILLRIPECMSVLVSSLVVRFTLNLIPFVRV